MVDRTSRNAGGLVVAVGVVLSGTQFLHGIEELAEGLPAVFYGVALPFLVSLLIVGSGYWISGRTWTDVSPWRMVGWCGGGFVVGVGLSALLVQYQAVEGISMSDPSYVLAMFGTYGGAFGLLVGRYDLQRRTQHARQVRKTERLDEFASIVSHDLRNPLNVASGRLDLARAECDSEHLNHVGQAQDRMEALIEDLLTLAREGESVTDFEPVELAATADACWATVETGNASLVNDVSRTVQADEQRLRQVFENLFRNAVEHGDHDVTVSVGNLPGGFYVEDGGPGIPETDRADVFEAGYSTSGEGTGFGLAIVEQIGDAHDWTIRITEGLEGGARFEFTGVEFVPE